jgi:hypothetical protein
MFAASGVFLLGIAGVFIFGLSALIARRRPYFMWPLVALAVLFGVAAVWGWFR